MAAREAFGPRRRRMAGKDSARRTPGIIRAAAGAERDQRHLSSRAGVDVATKRQVETKLRQLIKRLDQADHEVRGSLTESLPEARMIRVRVSSDHLVELVDGKKSMFSAYLAGQVGIEASFSDLLRLRKLA